MVFSRDLQVSIYYRSTAPTLYGYYSTKAYARCQVVHDPSMITLEEINVFYVVTWAASIAVSVRGAVRERDGGEIVPARPAPRNGSCLGSSS